MSNDAARRPESRPSCWPSVASGIRRIDGTSDRSSSKQGGTSWQTSPRRPAYRPGHPVQPDGQRGHAPRRRQLQHLYGGLLCRGRRAVGAFVPTVREAGGGAALMTDRATSSEQPRSAYGMRR